MSAHDALLDAYQSILRDTGERATTLTAVAARAGVSKGGLLYHFASKEALAEGLIARLDALVEEDLALMREAADGPSRYYVRTSVWAGGALDTTFVAVARVAQGSHAAARRGWQRAPEHWPAAVCEGLGGEGTGRASRLVGDGRYVEAARAGGPTRSGEGARAAGPGRPSPEQLLPIVDRLLHAARGRAGGVSGR